MPVSNSSIYIVFAIVIIIILLIVLCHNPFKYPYYHLPLDVSNKRNIDIQEEIEKYMLIYTFDSISKHQSKVIKWEKQAEHRINRSLFKKTRLRQYNKVHDPKNTYIVTLQRKQTRYKQKNYVRIPYIVYNTVEKSTFSYNDMARCYRQLNEIYFETTTRKYQAKTQRRLMTPALRNRIKKRDDYTCQNCGKVMYDEVGLHIDHIQPVSKNGKSVPSNLQVLCSKCNGQKSNR